MKTLLLLVFLGLAVAETRDGDKSAGGYVCSKQDAPWTVFLNFGHDMCSGALIHPRWVVSAAHCHQSKILVRLGEHGITATEGLEQFIDAELVIIHPKYDYITRDNDIMLIKLSRPAALKRNVVAVPLPTECAQTGDMCLISGWWRISNLGPIGYQLKCLETPVRSDADCRGSYPGRITDNMMVLAYLEGGRRLLKAKSGGPVVCNGVLQGVASWHYCCAVMGYPGVYTRVCNYVSWIHNIIATN